MLIHGVLLGDIEVSIGINYEEKPNLDGAGTTKTYVVQDIGDLDILSAYEVFQKPGATIKGDITLYEDANFDLLLDESIILSFKNGKLESKV